MTIQQARIAVGQQIGLPAAFDGTMSALNALSVDEKQSLTAGLINYIKNNPGSFTPGQVATANAEATRAGTLGLSDASFSVSGFMTELENNVIDAGSAVASVGTGVLTSTKMIGYLIPIAVLAAIVIFALPYIKRASQ